MKTVFSGAKRRKAALAKTSREVRKEKNPVDGLIGHELRRAQLATFHDLAGRFKDIGLRPAEFFVLRIIGSRPGLKHAEVALMLGIKRTNFVALMDSIGARGLAERRASATDRRSHALSLTEAGRQLLQQAMDQFDEHEAALVEKLGGEKERDALVELLARLTEGLARR